VQGETALLGEIAQGADDAEAVAGIEQLAAQQLGVALHLRFAGAALGDR